MSVAAMVPVLLLAGAYLPALSGGTAVVHESLTLLVGFLHEI